MMPLRQRLILFKFIVSLLGLSACKGTNNTLNMQMFYDIIYQFPLFNNCLQLESP